MKKILIVDDNASLITYMSRKLKEAGHEVVTAPDGLSAIEQLIAYTPDIIFIDYFLPTINGDVLCRIARRMDHLKDTYLVMMSAAAKELELDLSKLHANALIAKGTFRDTIEHFFSAIEEAGKPVGERKEPGIAMGIDSISPRQVIVELVGKYRHLEMVLDSISEGIMELRQGRIVYANPAAATILGQSRDEILVASPITLVDESERAKIRSLMKSATEDNIVITHRGRADGTDKVLSLRKLRLQDEPGTTIFLIADITEQVAAEEALRNHRNHLEALVEERTADLRRASERLLHSEKMGAVGTLAGGIAHDFNNILTALMGYGALLQTAMGEEDPLRVYVDQILTSSEKAARLTQGLLTFSRKQPMALKPMKLNGSIEKTEDLLKRLLTEDIELKTNLTFDDTTIMGDETQIDQILFNLVVNARDAMPRGGTLTVGTELTEMKEKFEDVDGYGEPGIYTVVSVSDTGSGMDQATREHIFDPFYTTKEAGKGTGLGLSTVYGIVRQHKGYIQLSSEPGKGSVFRVYFPAIAEKVERERPVRPEPAPGGGETILVAEDNEAVRTLLTAILTRYGYSVIEADDGEDAISKFREHKEIDLVIIDSVMPRKNGREVYDEVRKVNPGVKALFTSGYTRDVVLDKGIADDELHFLPKPITPDSLLSKVREVLG